LEESEGSQVKKTEKLRVGKETYEYTLVYKRIKNLIVRVYLDGSLGVSVPIGTSKAKIEEFLRSKSEFIQQAREKQAKRAQRKKGPIAQSGATLFYRGGKYTLSLEKGEGALRFSGKDAVLSVPDPENTAAAQKILEKKLEELLYPLVLESCRTYGPRFAPYGARPAREIRLKKMKSTWGTCRSTEGILTFSTMLIEVPPELLDYIVCHEYAHFVHPNHSPAFYEILGRVCPMHKKRREELKNKDYCL
jgi:predicted metal-dependent hydrolase